MRMKKIMMLMLVVFLVSCATQAFAQSNQKLHPRNKQLVQMGKMPVPKYYPEIPRITAQQAYSLYLSGKALFALISSSDKHLIVGGLHLTEDKPPKIDPNRLPLRKDQVLVLY